MDCLTIASEAGGGGRTADLSAELGKIGGLTGGGGLLEDELASVCIPPLVGLLVMSVRVCSGFAGDPSYSQMGSTMCPDGARSSWNTSVPRGRARARS